MNTIVNLTMKDIVHRIDTITYLNNINVKCIYAQQIR